MLIDAFVVLYGLRPKVIAQKDASKGPRRRKVLRVYSLYYLHRFCSPHGSNNYKHLVRSACDSTSFPSPFPLNFTCHANWSSTTTTNTAKFLKIRTKVYILRICLKESKGLHSIGKWLEDSKIKDSLRCFEADGDQMKRLSLTIFQAS